MYNIVWLIALIYVRYGIYNNLMCLHAIRAIHIMVS